jgi:two-component system chemotaxis response regulator CheB
MSDLIRVVIIDDSALMRRMIATMIARDPAIRVVGEARDGYEGIRLVQELRPDVVTMDVSMPGLDGLATTEHLMAYCPTPILVLTALPTDGEVGITFKMLGAGALEVVEKPTGNHPEAIERAIRDLVRRIKVLARVKVVTHLRGRRRAADLSERTSNTPEAPLLPGLPSTAIPPAPLPHRQRGGFPLIVLGASTGGPRVVQRILSELPANLAASILVVQHIAEGFSNGMVEWLQSSSPLPVMLASEGQLLCPGQVLVAPDQRDLLITPEQRIHLTRSPLLIQRPSIDIAMQAAAEVFATRAIGVILTGMGRDGAFGLLTIQRRGGYTIAQDEQSCSIFGMPRAAIQLGAATEVLSPPQITQRLIALVARQEQSASASAEELQ